MDSSQQARCSLQGWSGPPHTAPPRAGVASLVMSSDTRDVSLSPIARFFGHKGDRFREENLDSQSRSNGLGWSQSHTSFSLSALNTILSNQFKLFNYGKHQTATKAEGFNLANSQAITGSLSSQPACGQSCFFLPSLPFPRPRLFGNKSGIAYHFIYTHFNIYLENIKTVQKTTVLSLSYTKQSQ